MIRLGHREEKPKPQQQQQQQRRRLSLLLFYDGKENCKREQWYLSDT
jgi:hypothetical protein